MIRRTPLLLASILTVLAGCSDPADHPREPPAADRPRTEPSTAEWRQWGGPNGNFTVDAPTLATEWPATGPPTLWERELGEGYSAVVSGGEMLFTMYRERDAEVVIAVSARDGSTEWEHRYEAKSRPGNVTQFGTGPNATPLVTDELVIALGYTGRLTALARHDGTVRWEHDLVEDFGGQVLEFGYSASPILAGGRVVVLVGGERQAVLALDPRDGRPEWRSGAGTVSYATPVVIDVTGQSQLLYFAEDALVALDPANGERLWDFPVANQYKNHCTQPLWGDDGLLWVATQMDGGARVLRIERTDDRTGVEEVWSSQRLSVHFWNTLRLDGHVYASVGSNASLLVGVELSTGEVAWRERGFERVNFVHTGDATIILDGEGRLALARLSPEGPEFLSQAEIADGPTWTVPTLVGSVLYIRDTQMLRALDLGA